MLTSTWIATAAPVVRRVGLRGLAFPGVLLAHHLAYGWSFIRGLLGPQIDR
jgi:hypothetical protein